MIASSSIVRMVDFASFGPVGRSPTAVRLFHLATVLGLMPWRWPAPSGSLLTMLYRSTDRLCRGGAPVKNLSHSASFHRWLNNAPSNAGTKQLCHCLTIYSVLSGGTRVESDEFFSAAGAVGAETSLHRLVYNSTTGALYYDADGSGVSFNPIQFATLIGAPNLTFEDFSILGVG